MAVASGKPWPLTDRLAEHARQPVGLDPRRRAGSALLSGRPRDSSRTRASCLCRSGDISCAKASSRSGAREYIAAPVGNFPVATLWSRLLELQVCQRHGGLTSNSGAFWSRFEWGLGQRKAPEAPRSKMNRNERQRSKLTFLYRISTGLEIADEPRRKNKWCQKRHRALLVNSLIEAIFLPAL